MNFRLGDDAEASAMAATVRLALWCRAWRDKLPPVDGELGWEERFVGPVVTSVFEDLLLGPDMTGATVRWKGCVACACAGCDAR